MPPVVQSKDIIDVLESQEACDFILAHLDSDTASLALRYMGKVSFSLADALVLIGIYKKAKKKLPLFVEHMLAIDSRSYQQSTSQNIALYKQSQWQGDGLLDLTGGIGVDSMLLAKSFSRCTVIERNSSLNHLASYNLSKLKVSNVDRVEMDADTFLSQSDAHYSLVYIDPDRRDTEGRKLLLEDLSPNVLSLLPKLKPIADRVYVKLSPLYDIDEIWRNIPAASEVWVLSERNEVKEVGVLIDYKAGASRTIRLYETESKSEHLIDFFHSKRAVKTTEYKVYLHVPNASVAKSRTSEYFFVGKDVSQLGDYYLYTSNEENIEEHRNFKIIGTTSVNAKWIKKLLNTHQILQCNVVVKGSRETPAQWHKKLKTRDGGAHYLYLLKGDKQKLAILAKFIS